MPAAVPPPELNNRALELDPKHQKEREIYRVSQAKFKTLSGEEKRDKFRKSHLHVFWDGRESKDPFQGPRDFKESRQALEFLGVDLCLTRTVYGRYFF